MDTQIVVVFCLVDDMLKALHHHEDPQCHMKDAEVMTTVIVAMLYFRGNFCLACRFMFEGGSIPGMLGKSRFPGLSGQDRQPSSASHCRFVFDPVFAAGRVLETAQ
ncbi:MAG TPA: hypothetical protein VMT46_14375 [Anaerolineaceae bacterium]|nr:hypothetical protein [Anaerolineaceae bacterium]